MRMTPTTLTAICEGRKEETTSRTLGGIFTKNAAATGLPKRYARARVRARYSTRCSARCSARFAALRVAHASAAALVWGAADTPNALRSFFGHFSLCSKRRTGVNMEMCDDAHVTR